MAADSFGKQNGEHVIKVNESELVANDEKFRSEEERHKDEPRDL